MVSNPPYISIEDYKQLEEELLQHEPKNALTDEKDGYSFYNLISEKASKILSNNGKLFFEVGYGQAEHVGNIMRKNGFDKIEFIKDYQNIDRVVTGELI